MSFMQRLKDKFTKKEEQEVSKTYKEGMEKTRQSFAGKINDLIARYRSIDEDFFEELEEVLITADVGVMTVMELIDELKMEVKRQNVKDPTEVRDVISEKLVEDRKSTRLNSSHVAISYAVFCLKKKKKKQHKE